MNETHIIAEGGQLKLKANPDAPITKLRGFDRAATVTAAGAANSVPALRGIVAELADRVADLIAEVERLRG